MWVLLLIKTAEPVLPSSVQLLVKCALPQGRRWAGEKHRYWILGVSAFSTSAGPWPKMMSFKLSRLLVWSPMILSTSPFSCKQSFHDFVSLCHIKECVRKTYRCVLRIGREYLPSNQRHQDKLMVSGDSQLCLWLSVLPWTVSIWRAVVVAVLPLPLLAPSKALLWSPWHRSALSKCWLCWMRSEALG